MTHCEFVMQEEQTRLCAEACLSVHSKGRERPEPHDPIRPPFRRDADRIVHAKAFRRLAHKTQVFLMPIGDHYRTRLTHALEVSRIARTMARALRLNEDLTEAIALGHDLGHTPFGHAGERALAAILPFSHNEQSLRVVEVLEKDGQGMNLTFEVRDGIQHHTGAVEPATQEGKLVHLADRVAYLSHDMDDAMRGGILAREDVPQELRESLGDTPRERINTFVLDVIQNGALSAERQVQMDALRAFMFERVYKNPVAKGEESKIEGLIQSLFKYYKTNFDELPPHLKTLSERDGRERVICDYIAGMTDRFFEQRCMEILIPIPWTIL